MPVETIIDVKECRRLELEEGLNRTEIAARLGVHRASVTAKMTQAGYPAPPRPRLTCDAEYIAAINDGLGMKELSEQLVGNDDKIRENVRRIVKEHTGWQDEARRFAEKGLHAKEIATEMGVADRIVELLLDHIGVDRHELNAQRIVVLVSEGMNQYEIAAMLKVGQGTVSRNLGALGIDMSEVAKSGEAPDLHLSADPETPVVLTLSDKQRRTMEEQGTIELYKDHGWSAQAISTVCDLDVDWVIDLLEAEGLKPLDDWRRPHVERRMQPRETGTWFDRAHCAGFAHTSIFYPALFRNSGRDKERYAGRLICSACPVQQQCLEAAVARRENHGICAGVRFDSPLERRRAGVRPTR